MNPRVVLNVMVFCVQGLKTQNGERRKQMEKYRLDEVQEGRGQK